MPLIDPQPLAREYVRAALKRHATRPARPEVEAAYDAARDALQAALRECGGSWCDGPTRYTLDAHGSLLVLGTESPLGVTRRPMVATRPGWWAHVEASAEFPVTIKGPATDEELTILSDAFQLTIAAWRARPVTTTAFAMGNAKRALEAALVTRGGKWGQYKVGHGARLPKVLLEPQPRKEAS